MRTPHVRLRSGPGTRANETSTPIGWCYSVVVGVSPPGISSGPIGGPSLLTGSRALTALADTFLHASFPTDHEPSLSGMPSGACRCRYVVEAIYKFSSELTRQRIGWGAFIEELGKDRCLSRIASESLDWPMMALSATESDFEVLSPPEFLAHLQERSVRFSRVLF